MHTKRGEKNMGINPSVKKNWIAIQKNHNIPVNAIGVRIDPKDKKTLKVWKEEEIYKFMQR
jgi:hypothetical protein